jgi:hypothetical protein
MEMTLHGRLKERRDLLTLLDEWRRAEETASFYERYEFQSSRITAKAARNEADDLKELLLQRMMKGSYVGPMIQEPSP